MCKISLETVRLANEALMRRTDIPSEDSVRDDFSVSTTYNGKVFTANISRDDLNAAYADAYKKVMCG